MNNQNTTNGGVNDNVTQITEQNQNRQIMSPPSPYSSILWQSVHIRDPRLQPSPPMYTYRPPILEPLPQTPTFELPLNTYDYQITSQNIRQPQHIGANRSSSTPCHPEANNCQLSHSQISTPPPYTPRIQLRSLQSLNVKSGQLYNFLLAKGKEFVFISWPFHDVVSKLIEPSIITKDFGPIPEAESRISVLSKFDFRLSCEQIKLISTTCDLSDQSRPIYPIECQLRISAFDSVTREALNIMPPCITVELNNKVINLPKLPRNERLKTIPIHLTNELILNPSAHNKIRITCYPDGGRTYLMVINLVKKVSPYSVISRLLQRAPRSVEETRMRIINFWRNSGSDIFSLSFRVFLDCPISKQRIAIPAMSINCTHLQCFDAHVYLNMNEKSPTWKCPICKKSCTYEEIQIQLFFAQVLLDPRVGVNVKEIELLPDGTWKAFYDTYQTATNYELLSDDGSNNQVTDVSEPSQ